MNNKITTRRNKTLTLTQEELKMFSTKLVNLKNNQSVEINDIINKTVNNNLFEVIDLLPIQFADLIFIDPPYNLTKNYHGFTFQSSTDEQYLDYLRSWFPKVVSLLKPNGSLYLCGDWKCTSALQTVMNENLTVLNRITWQREKGRGAMHNWKNGMEDIWYGVKNHNDYYFNVEAVKIKRKVIAPYKIDGKPKDWEETEIGNFRTTYPSNFWDDISIPYWSMSENTCHPTQKPEKLLAKLILASCPPNGIVFDPFLGSGTSSVVAKKLNRKYCGVEMNEEYCCWAEKRLKIAEKNPIIQGYTDGVFWERNSSSIQQKLQKKSAFEDFLEAQ
ncbi:MAG: DNA adenine methylase [Dysgonamonadaceae bacterium]|jgi:site-specific DNA-methyltransferase (adenine-specific)|nr:DNA adenine methylase [Dysgonamonadaceae bacterium]